MIPDTTVDCRCSALPLRATGTPWRAIWMALGMASCTSSSPPPTPTSLVESPVGAHLDSVLTPYVEELRRLTDNTAGLAIGITQGGRIVYARTFGSADLARNAPADFDTRFHVASVSKPFTAMAVLRLVADGAVDLDAPIARYIPDFRMQGEGAGQVTVRHALTHTAGIPRDLSANNWEHPVFGPDALEQNLTAAREATLEFAPGSRFSYSNSGYDLLGLLVRRVGGMPFEEFVRTRILEPAGMAGATYDKPVEGLPPNWATPHSYGISTQEWAPYPFSGVNTPSTGLQATVLDMSRWGLLHLAGGRHDDVAVIDSTLFRQMVSPQATTPWGEAIGFGWYLQSHLGHPTIMHLGNDTGFESAMYIYPEDDVSIVVLANRDFSRTGRIALAAAEILFGADPAPFTVSAKYRFAAIMRAEGMPAAAGAWEALRSDTTDRYEVDDDDLLTTGAVLENGKQWGAARDVLGYYLSLHDASPYGWRLLGNAHAGLGDTAAAIAAYRDALRVDPGYERGRQALEALLAR